MMARLQILELPEGSEDDRPPFILIFDQLGEDDFENLAAVDQVERLKAEAGARAVLAYPGTIDIPANEVPVDPDGYPLKIRIEPDFETFREQVQEEILAAQGKVTQALRSGGTQEVDGPKCQYCGADCSDSRSWDGGDLYACPSCADWRAKLNRHKTALTDALGMDRLRDWDDIRNAAAALRKERDARAAEVERLRAGEELVTDERVTPNPGQWIYQWNRVTAEKRLGMAAQILDGMPRANNCLMLDHEARLADLRAEVERLRAAKPDA